MKQFVVVRIGELLDMRIPNWIGVQHHRFGFWQFQRESSDGGGMSRDHDMYFTESLESAQCLAKELAKKNPGTQYMVAAGSDVYECKAAPVMSARWTAAGLLPA